MDFEKYLKDSADMLGICVDDCKCRQFKKYAQMLAETNKVMNLTALTEESDIITKHFIDSISPLKFTDLKGTAIDVGTGAGFPSVPLKIMCPDLKLTLLDSLAKRIEFLKNVCRENNITDVEFIHSRAEDMGRNEMYRERFDFCLSRAVAELNVLCEYCLPFVRTGGMFIALKGPMIFDEIKSAERALEILGGEVVRTEEVLLPNTDITHYIAFIKKVHAAPEKYPRKFNQISKKAL